MNRRDLLKGLLPASAAWTPVRAWAQQPRFETGVSEIRVDAAVKYRSELLHELKREDFLIRDEGAVQPVLAFEEAAAPLDLVLLQGVIGSPRLEAFKRASNDGFASAMTVAGQMRPQDRVAIISYATGRPQLELPLTSDRDKVAETLNGQRSPSGRTGVNDTNLGALQWGIWLLDADIKATGTAAGKKRAILMLELDNGHEEGSSLGWGDDPLIRQLWALDTAFHAVLFDWKAAKEPPETRAPFYRIANLWHIARATGGEVATDGEKSVPDVLAGIRSTYRLSYKAPEAAPGSLRHITVELSEAAKEKYPGAEVRAREGYIAR